MNVNIACLDAWCEVGSWRERFGEFHLNPACIDLLKSGYVLLRGYFAWWAGQRSRFLHVLKLLLILKLKQKLINKKLESSRLWLKIIICLIWFELIFFLNFNMIIMHSSWMTVAIYQKSTWSFSLNYWTGNWFIVKNYY